MFLAIAHHHPPELPQTHRRAATFPESIKQYFDYAHPPRNQIPSCALPSPSAHVPGPLLLDLEEVDCEHTMSTALNARGCDRVSETIVIEPSSAGHVASVDDVAK